MSLIFEEDSTRRKRSTKNVWKPRKLTREERELITRLIEALRARWKDGTLKIIETSLVPRKLIPLKKRELRKLARLNVIEVFDDWHPYDNVLLKFKVWNEDTIPLFFEDLPKPPKGVRLSYRRPVTMHDIDIVVERLDEEVREYIDTLLSIARKHKLLGVHVCIEGVRRCNFLYIFDNSETISRKLDELSSYLKR